MIWPTGHQLQGGKYEIIRKLGDGGFGLTYLAFDSSLDRNVVIKTPKKELESDSEYERFKRRFQREGQSLAKISHPNVVQIISSFEEEGLPCLVMAYITGQSLHEQILNTGPIPQETAVKYFLQLAEALDYAHQVGVVHCDIHPGNIILQSGNKPVLIDFGSAKLLQPSAVTVTTTINDAFCPHEQGRSEAQVTLDVYGLAATLYFAVTGQKPLKSIDRKFYGDTLIRPKRLVKQIDDCLEKAILAGMAIDAENRPASMHKLLEIFQAPQYQARFSIQPTTLKTRFKTPTKSGFSAIWRPEDIFRKIQFTLPRKYRVKALASFANPFILCIKYPFRKLRLIIVWTVDLKDFPSIELLTLLATCIATGFLASQADSSFSHANNIASFTWNWPLTVATSWVIAMSWVPCIPNSEAMPKDRFFSAWVFVWVGAMVWTLLSVFFLFKYLSQELAQRFSWPSAYALGIIMLLTVDIVFVWYRLKANLNRLQCIFILGLTSSLGILIGSLTSFQLRMM